MNIYIFHRFFSRNSGSTNLCGKVPFALEPQRKFLHRANVEKNNFSTGLVEGIFSSRFSTERFSTFHRGCGENLDYKKSKVRCMLLSCPAKKVTKECGQRGAEAGCSRAQSRPLWKPPARTWYLLAHLNGQNLFSGCGFTNSAGFAQVRGLVLLL